MEPNNETVVRKNPLWFPDGRYGAEANPLTDRRKYFEELVRKIRNNEEISIGKDGDLDPEEGNDTGLKTPKGVHA